MRVTVSRVRIPFSPPNTYLHQFKEVCISSVMAPISGDLIPQLPTVDHNHLSQAVTYSRIFPRKSDLMMARRQNKLTARSVATLKKVGRHSDGGGLYLLVSPNGSKSWVFMYERTIGGRRKQTELGLGSAEGALAVSLADARQRADTHRATLRDGNDPKTVREQLRADTLRNSITFGEFADDYIKTHSPEWSSAKHVAQWRMTLSDVYCAPIRPKLCEEVTLDDVLSILKPIWQSKPETARRIRMRLERVLDAARVRGLRKGENPARWRGNLDHLLPKHGKASKTHHLSLPFVEVPGLMSDLSARPAMAALALRFLILTASRTGEVIGAKWSEIDLETATWTIPASRMKARRSHRVPLSDEAIAVLEKVRGISSDLVFPGPSLTRPLSNMAMLNLLKRIGIGERATVHGFRSSFRDWVAECTDFPSEVAEMALAHAVANATEAAYRRGDLFNKRREMMEAWANYCCRPDSNVVSLKLKSQAQ